MGSVGQDSYSIPEKQLRALERIANRTRNLKNEQSRIVDSDGNVLIEKHGQTNEVAYTVGEKRDYMNGNIVIHNHPRGGTFSVDDLRDFGYGAKESWIATPEGNYKLINTKAGTPDAKKTWVQMQEDYDKVTHSDESYLSLRRRAQEAPAIKELQTRANTIAEQYVNARNAGAPQEEQNRIYQKYENVRTQISPLVDKEMRRLEVTPFHEWLKKNASKYKFKYVFEQKGK